MLDKKLLKPKEIYVSDIKSIFDYLNHPTSRKDGPSLVRALLFGRTRNSQAIISPAMKLLGLDNDIRNMLYELSLGMLLTLNIPSDRKTLRAVLKVSYTETDRGRWRSGFGLFPATYRLRLDQFRDNAKLRARIIFPKEMYICGTALTGVTDDNRSTGRVVVDARWTRITRLVSSVDIQDIGLPGYLKNILKGKVEYFINISVVPKAAYFSIPALVVSIISLFISVAMFAAFYGYDGKNDSLEPIVTTASVLPTLSIVYMSLHDEHEHVTYSLTVPRIVLISSVSVLLSGGVLFGFLDKTPSHQWLKLLYNVVVISQLASVFFFSSMLLNSHIISKIASSCPLGYFWKLFLSRLLCIILMLVIG